jgi:hypothetical protein
MRQNGRMALGHSAAAALQRLGRAAEGTVVRHWEVDAEPRASFTKSRRMVKGRPARLTCASPRASTSGPERGQYAGVARRIVEGLRDHRLGGERDERAGAEGAEQRDPLRPEAAEQVEGERGAQRDAAQEAQDIRARATRPPHAGRARQSFGQVAQREGGDQVKVGPAAPPRAPAPPPHSSAPCTRRSASGRAPWRARQWRG